MTPTLQSIYYCGPQSFERVSADVQSLFSKFRFWCWHDMVSPFFKWMLCLVSIDWLIFIDFGCVVSWIQFLRMLWSCTRKFWFFNQGPKIVYAIQIDFARRLFFIGFISRVSRSFVRICSTYFRQSPPALLDRLYLTRPNWNFSRAILWYVHSRKEKSANSAMSIPLFHQAPWIIPFHVTWIFYQPDSSPNPSSHPEPMWFSV